jgi:alpha-beta hydrolase superfamily lysophospholipase
MQTSKFSFTADDGHKIHGIQWRPNGRVNACVQIVHGMAEYAARYQRLAEELVGDGYAVFAHDLRGHGAQAEKLGHFADADGWQANINDIHKVNEYIHLCHPKLPLAMLGHSMGTHLVKDYIARPELANNKLAVNGKSVDAVMLSASFGSQGLLGKLALNIAKLERWRCGAQNASPIIHALTFGAWAKKINDHGTEFDWLNREKTAVVNYSDDKLCGFKCSTQLWLDFFTALQTMHKSKYLGQTPKNLPILMMTGTDDLSNGGVKGCNALQQQYKQTGLSSLYFKVWPGARHELLNETNRIEIISFCKRWLATEIGHLMPK